ncbi:hypothetical protein SAMN05216436_101133 [bacterium A37T11]|nr:hypothetical protein SAMN05216436_101133 [bacterium A37T11]
MISTLFSFEIKQHVKKAFTWVFLVLMIAQGVFYMHHAGEFYSADETHANAPAIVYTVLAGMGYLSFIVGAILAGTALGKDLEYRTAPILFTTRVHESTYFLARYAGSLCVLAFLCSGYLLGIWSYNFLPVAHLGPFSWMAFFRALLLIFIPNVLILYTLAFSIAVLSKNIRAAYMVALAGILLMIFAESSFGNYPRIVLADPTAFTVLHQLLENLSTAEKNAFSPSFSGLLGYNRLLWLGLALLSFIIAYRRFSYRQFSSLRLKKNKKEALGTGSFVSTNMYTLSGRQFRFSIAGYWRKLLPLSWLAFKSVVRPVGFRIFLALILFIYVCYAAMWQQAYYSVAPTLPTALEMTQIVGPLSFYIQLFLVVQTVELLFRDQTSGFCNIGDALPVPSWLSVLSKVCAMLMVAFFLMVSLITLAIAIQFLKGYDQIEWNMYFRNMLLRWVPKYVCYILLCTFIAGVTALRYASIWLCVAILVISSLLHDLGIVEQHRHFQPTEEGRREKALYERKYWHYARTPRPLIESIWLHADLYPSRRTLQYRASLQMANTTDRPIDTLHIEWKDFSEIQHIAATGYRFTRIMCDTVLRHAIYVLEPALPAGATMGLAISGEQHYKGFTNEDPQKDLTFNGSFLQDLVPFFGYDDRRTLKENNYRVKYGLPKLRSRLAAPGAPVAGNTLFASNQAVKADFLLSVSTDAGQTIVAPGRLEKQWYSHGRPHFRYRSVFPDVYDLKLLSATYKHIVSTVSIQGKTTSVEVYAHPGHSYNVAKIAECAKDALVMLQPLLGT